MQRKWPTRIAPSVLAALLQSSVLLGAWGQDRARAGDPSSPDEVSPIVTLQPSGPDEQIPYAVEPRTEPTLSNQRITALLRQRIKYVFVIFNENHSTRTGGAAALRAQRQAFTSPTRASRARTSQSLPS